MASIREDETQTARRESLFLEYDLGPIRDRWLYRLKSSLRNGESPRARTRVNWFHVERAATRSRLGEER